MDVKFPFSNPGAADTDPGSLANGFTGLDYVPGKHRRKRKHPIGFALPQKRQPPPRAARKR